MLKMCWMNSELYVCLLRAFYMYYFLPLVLVLSVGCFYTTEFLLLNSTSTKQSDSFHCMLSP